jgi:aspartate/glutamate racemase
LINLELLKLTHGKRTADLLLWSFDTTRIEPLVGSGKWNVIGELLQDAANRLIDCKVEGILIASNTIHKVITQKLVNLPVPLIDIRDSLLQEIRRREFRKIAFIGTSSTMTGDVYQNLIDGSCGVEVVLPPQYLWGRVDDMIFNRICRGMIIDEDRKFFSEVIFSFHNHRVDCVVLGCTELFLLDRVSPHMTIGHLEKCL